MFLDDIIKKYPLVSGYECSPDKFPIIVKLIDACDNLSVQVHPDKNEMWYIIDCDENSCILYGFKESISKQDFERHIRNNTVIPLMNKVPVCKGDVFHINTGTIHALGKGILAVEIQQSSNVTYRIYDYNRKDENGNTRPLHINQALKVINFNRQDELYHKTYTKNNIKILDRCDSFNVCEISVNPEYQIFNDKSSFSHIFIKEGTGIVSDRNQKENFKKGDSFFLPAGYDYKIKGKSEIILTTTSQYLFKYF